MLPVFAHIRAFCTRPAFWNYVLVLVLVFIAQIGTEWLLPVTKNMIFLLFCTAITMSGIQGGFRAGVLATLLSAASCSYWFIPPLHSFANDGPGQLKIELLISTGLLISGLCERLHIGRRQAERKWKEAEGNQQRQELLSQLSASLTAAAPFALGLQNVALLLTRRFVSLCLIDVVGPDGKLRRIAASSADLMDEQFAERMAACCPMDASFSYGPTEVLRSGRPEIVRHLNPEVPQHQMLADSGYCSYLSLPLYAPGRRLGVFTLAYAKDRDNLTPDALSLATEIARHIAIRIANEGLLWDAQEEIRQLQAQLDVRARPQEMPLAGRSL